MVVGPFSSLLDALGLSPSEAVEVLDVVWLAAGLDRRADVGTQS